MSEEEKISRRKYIKYAAAGAVAVGAAAAGIYYLTLPTAPEEELPASKEYLDKFPDWEYYWNKGEALPTLKYLGGAWMMYPEVAEFWEKVHKQPVEASYLDLFIMAQRIVATEGYGWDVGGVARFPPIKKAEIIQPIPVSNLPMWKEDKVVDIFIHPETYFKAENAERFNYNLWFSEDDYTSRQNLAMVVTNWNFDSVTYLPEFLPYEEKGGAATSFSYSQLWNPQWKGRAMMQDEAMTVFGETANELDATGQMDISGATTNLTRAEVDTVYNYLLPIIESGQIRTFWFKYGDCVNLLSTKEIYIGSTWQPPCYDCRRAGTPAYYARLKNGPFFWFNGDILSKRTAIAEDVFKFMNFRIGIWWDAFILGLNGYGTFTSNYDEVREYMGAEFFDWANRGNATYLPIDQVIKDWCWPDKEDLWTLDERLQQALFLPDKYFPPGAEPRTGSPNAKGNLRDLGSIADKLDITRYSISPDLPDDETYYVEKYTDLKAHIPG